MLILCYISKFHKKYHVILPTSNVSVKKVLPNFNIRINLAAYHVAACQVADGRFVTARLNVELPNPILEGN